MGFLKFSIIDVPGCKCKFHFHLFDDHSLNCVIRSKVVYEFFNKTGFLDIRDEQPVAGSCDGYVYESFYLVLGPDARLELVEAHQENAGVIKPFGAVNGGYADSLGGNVI